MARKPYDDDQLIKALAENMLLVLPYFRKKTFHMDSVKERFGLSLSQVQIIAMLEQIGKMSVSSISERMGIAKPNVTPLVESLSKSGYVLRRRDESDHRAVNVYVTPSGKEVLESVREYLAGEVSDWSKEFSRQEVKTLSESFAGIAKVLGK
ncbi:MAG: MarR family transcriptional regulator [Eubacteriales bacterium]|nr:MarR family transcriptional regulator [Eubacteriales bacterium]MDD3882436.1 MarR family transcriptional regulator [Eubacteriales bacterium]MDD4513158.1 MarR family transcriptional regulator [Eubacteriales bacterium]